MKKLAKGTLGETAKDLINQGLISRAVGNNFLDLLETTPDEVDFSDLRDKGVDNATISVIIGFSVGAIQTGTTTRLDDAN